MIVHLFDRKIFQNLLLIKKIYRNHPISRNICCCSVKMAVIRYVILVLGLISLLVWAFDGNTNASKSSWAKAMLVWHLISMVFAVFILLIVLSLKI